MITQARPATTRAMLNHIAAVDLRPILPQIDVPTLLLYGDADVRAATPVADALHAQIPRRSWCSYPASVTADTSKHLSNGTGPS